MTEKAKLRSRTLLAGGCTALFLLVAIIASKSPAALRGQAIVSTSLEAKAKRENLQRPSTGFTVSASPSAQELGRYIDREIDESEFGNARWGLFVIRLRDGSVLYARDADRPIAPASNMKLYSTGVALDLLGADYRWRTSVYTKSGPDKSGAIEGNVVLYGRGAPDLSSRSDKKGKSSFDELADALYQRGVRRVRGDIVGDESFFRGDALGDGWLWNDVQWYFGAEVSALSINGNQIELSVSPPEKFSDKATIKLEHETGYVKIINQTASAERGTPATIGITRGLSDNVVRVWGEFPLAGRGFTARLSVHRPALWAAILFRDALESRGISIEGDARAVDAREDQSVPRTDQNRDVELASIKSRTLAEIVRLTNKESINLYAELILRTLGKEHGSSAPDPDPKKMRTRGDDAAGLAVIRSWLEAHKIPTDALALHDGSGLSRLDLVTPEATARLLVSMTQVPAARVFRDSLPVAGRDGTLKFRLRGRGAGRIVAKTGTLTYINSLSGYATTADDEQVAFSIISNEEASEASSSQLIDKIAAFLTSFKASNR